MVSFVDEMSLELLDSVMRKFVTNNTMKKVTSLKLLKINTSDKGLHKQVAVEVGMEAEMLIRESKKQLN